MPTVMLGTGNALLDQNFTRLAAAVDAKLAAGTPVAHPPTPGYTATLGLAYTSDSSLNANFDAFDNAITNLVAPKFLRSTASDVINANFKKLAYALQPIIVIPQPSTPSAADAEMATESLVEQTTTQTNEEI